MFSGDLLLAPSAILCFTCFESCQNWWLGGRENAVNMPSFTKKQSSIPLEKGLHSESCFELWPKFRFLYQAQSCLLNQKMDFWIEVEEHKLTGRGNQSQTITGKSVIRSKQGCRADIREQIKNNLASPCVFLYFFFSFSIQVLFKGLKGPEVTSQKKI